MNENITILLSRTDSIGDVILTLPMAGIIKQKYPNAKIIFLGNAYTKDVISCSEYVDEYLNWSEIKTLKNKEQIDLLKSKKIDVFIHVFPNFEIAKLAFNAKIKCRIGTSHRLYNYLFCNDLPSFSRKKSELHEAELNIKLLKKLEINFSGPISKLTDYYGFTRIPQLKQEFKNLLIDDNKNIILHTKSKGSAREWGLPNFKKLIKISLENGAKVFLTGTEEEGKLFRKDLMFSHKNLVDLSGKMDLKDLISFIANADILVAASTGPLHIAAAVEIKAIGIFPPIKPMHPGRWAPIGLNTKVFVSDKNNCDDCKNGNACICMQSINAEDVAKEIFV